LLQHIAEAAARSGARPLIVVAVLHQSVAGYASGLASAHRREWEKVAGRYEEVVFAPPLAQAAALVAAALDLDTKACPAALLRSVERTMEQALDQNWYGLSATRPAMRELAPALLPLDPTVLPVISRFMRRFGQNERSLFGFLSSSEPFGLMAHASGPIKGFEPYRIHDFFDYLAANFDTVLQSGPHAARWNQIRAILDSAAGRTSEETRVLKTVALLNLIDDPALPSSSEAVALAAGGADKRSAGRIGTAIASLTRDVRVLYDRGTAGALCLWPHTSVDLEEAFSTALEAVSREKQGFDHFRRLVRTDPLVARRHYVEFGALRHFEITCLDAENVRERVEVALDPGRDSSDGRIFLILSGSEQARSSVWKTLASCTLAPTVLVGVSPPINRVQPLLTDALAWRWVRDHVPELAGDAIARNEAARQLALAEERLARTLGGLLDIRGDAAAGMRWRDRDGECQFASARMLMAHLSSLCDRAFGSSPRVRNELINRRRLSSAAARARHQLIEALATGGDQPLLGLPEETTPAEKAIYLSVLQHGGVHVKTDAGWEVRIPPEADDPLNLAPALNMIGNLLREADAPVGYAKLANRLRGQDFGIRDGLIPLLVAIYLRAHWHETAVYEDGTYLEQVGGPEFARITKEPEFFEFQHCAIEGVRAELYVRLGSALGAQIGDEPALLDIVRPLMTFVGKQLPDYARRTRRLAPATIAARDALISGRDPSALLFRELPEAFDLDRVGPDCSSDSAVLSDYVTALAAAVRELRGAYPKLLERLAAALGAALDAGAELSELRPTVMLRARTLASALTEPELRAFVLRLADEKLDDVPWLESIASFVARKPAERWADNDEQEFHQRLSFLARRFSQVEAVHFPGESDGDSAIRIAITSADGAQSERIFRSRADDAAAIAEAEAVLAPVLERAGAAGRIAAARLLLATLAESDDEPGEGTRPEEGATS